MYFEKLRFIEDKGKHFCQYALAVGNADEGGAHEEPDDAAACSSRVADSRARAARSIRGQATLFDFDALEGISCFLDS